MLPTGLKPRENEILKLVSEGNSYKQCARVLNLSIQSIKVYIGTAKDKLGAKSICHAIAIWIGNIEG